MKEIKSEVTAKPYPMRQILSIAELSSSAWFDKRPRKKASDRGKPGPRTLVSDAEILSKIHAYMKTPDFNSEGYIKIHARFEQRRSTANAMEC